MDTQQVVGYFIMAAGFMFQLSIPASGDPIFDELIQPIPANVFGFIGLCMLVLVVMKIEGKYVDRWNNYRQEE